MSKNGNGFYLKEWEIWYTYTTSLRPTKIDLKNLADRLVRSELAYLSMLKEGYTVWNSINGIRRGNTTVDLNGKTILLDENGEKTIPDDFAGEAWYQCSHFRYSELRLFNAYPSLPPNYVRAFLGKCILHKYEQNQRIHLYPILTIYETGVMSVEFRRISPSIPFSLNEFISEVVNIPQLAFDKVDAPPPLSKITSKAYIRGLTDWNMRERSKLLKWEKEHNQVVDTNTFIDESDKFLFELSTLSSKDDQKEWLDELASIIFNSVVYLLSKSREGKKFFLFGNKISQQFYEYRIVRPHIYLCEFSDQQETASLNEEINKDSFIKILMQSVEFPEESQKKFLPKDSRLFEDYSAYLGQTLSLWVWSKKGIRQQEPWNDGNRGHLVYEQQATMRLHDYVYVLHRRLLKESLHLKNYDQVISTRRELLNLEQKISELSSFGEIRELLKQGWSQMGLQEIKNRINKALLLQQEEKSNKETRNYRKIGITLTVFFGLASIPTIAIEILKPFWELLNWIRPKDELSFQILLLSIVFALISIVIIGLVKVTKRES